MLMLSTFFVEAAFALPAVAEAAMTVVVVWMVVVTFRVWTAVFDFFVYFCVVAVLTVFNVFTVVFLFVFFVVVLFLLVVGSFLV